MASPSGSISLVNHGAYYEPQSKRSLLKIRVGPVELDLSKSQANVLSRIVDYADEYLHRPVTVPLYISSETGAGKTEVALDAAALLAAKLSKHLRIIHAVYVAPTRLLSGQAASRGRLLEAKMGSALPNIECYHIHGKLEYDVKGETIRNAFSMAEDKHIMIFTNPQMLSSLATQTKRRYGIPDRTGKNRLIEALAEPNLYIIDEAHFYSGKTFTRLLILLYEILSWKVVASVTNPTFLLFLSATMNPTLIEAHMNKLFKILFNGELTPPIAVNIPLHNRMLKITDKEAGEKWIQMSEAESTKRVVQLLASETSNISDLAVVYSDNINLLITIQRMIESYNVKTAILHSQMPRATYNMELEKLKDKDTQVLLITSLGEIGVEFEAYDRTVELMFSINSQSIAKIVQRLGRLARRYSTKGIFYNIDLPWIRVKTSNRFSNKHRHIRVGGALSKRLPKFLDKAMNMSDEFFTSYISPKADKQFHQNLKEKTRHGAKGRIPQIYIIAGLEVENVESEDDRITLPISKICRKIVPITKDESIEVFPGIGGGFLFRRTAGKVKGRRFLNIFIRSLNRKERILNFEKWLREIGVQIIIYSEDATLELNMPKLSHNIIFHSPILILHFKRNILPPGDISQADAYNILLENLEPATQDLDIIRESNNPDSIILYEPALITSKEPSIGAVENVYHMLVGEK